MNNPIITVGIPLRNKGEFIGQTIISLKQQSLSNWVCLISENMSEDNSLREAIKFIGEDKRFKIIQQKKLLNHKDNWNYLVQLSQSKYFKLLHADDLLVPTCLANSVSALELDDKYSFVAGKRKITFRSKNVKLNQKNNKFLIKKVYSKSEFINRHQISGKNFVGEPSFITFRTDRLKEIGGFNSEWQYMIDMATYLSTLQTGDLILLKNHMGVFRISNNSWSKELSENQYEEEKKFLELYDKTWYSFFGKFFVFFRSKLRRYVTLFVSLRYF